jgi:zinc protease
MGAMLKWLAAAPLAFGLASAAYGEPAIEPILVERPPADVHQIRWDPAIRHGVLPNGLRYAVMQNATPKGGVSIRLGVGVGSLDERDDELGAAHFLEHMAFGGSRAQLQADVEKAFAGAGVAFGRDRNAQTSNTETVYEIDLPRSDDAGLDLGFQWLRKVADGASLTPADVDRERGVIQAEREQRLSDISEAMQRVMAFQLPGGRLAKAPIIGTEASVAALTAPQLQAFYRRWYQPQNAAVTVVGDEPLDELEARVSAAFSGWKPGSDPIPAHDRPTVDTTRGLGALALAGPHLPNGIAACRIAPLSGGDQLTRYERKTRSEVWGNILSARFASQVRDPSAGMISGLAISGDIDQVAHVACLGGAPVDGAWRQAVLTLGGDAARAATEAPTEDELETSIKALRATIRGELEGASTRASSELSDAALTSLLLGDAFPSPVEKMRIFDVAVEGMTPADAQAAFRADWSGAGPLVDVLSNDPPPVAEVKQAFLSGASSMTQSASAGSVTGAASLPAPVWRYADFGKPGRVVRREAIVDSDFVRLTFANGAVLNFKHTNYERGAVAARLSFGGGRHDIAPSDLFLAQLGASLVARGGLEKDSFSDLNSIFSETGLAVAFSIDDNDFALTANTRSASLGDALHLMTAYVTEPGFRDLDPMLPTVWRAMLRTIRGFPSIVLTAALNDAIAPGNPVGLAALDAAPTPTSAGIARVLKPALTGAPLELNLVGDVPESDATVAAAATIGALPPRRAGAAARSDAWFLRFPEHLPPMVTAVHDGPPEKAAVAMVWPLFTAEPSRQREEYALILACQVFHDALMRQIRGELSKAYSPTAMTVMQDHGDQGYLIAEAEVPRADVDLVRAQIAAVAAKVAGGAFTDQDLESARKPLLAGMSQHFASNEFWAQVLARSSVDDSDIKAADHFVSTLASITPAEVHKAATDWLARPSTTLLVVGRAQASSGATAP